MSDVIAMSAPIWEIRRPLWSHVRGHPVTVTILYICSIQRLL
jgi:hypothetical protein